MALEYLVDEYFTMSSDVWSFGVLFWEILSCGKMPYGPQEYDEVVPKLKSGYRLQCPENVDNILTWSPKAVFQKLSNKCFVAEPTERGTFCEVAEILEKELSHVEISDYSQMCDIYHNTRARNYLKLDKSIRVSVHTMLELDRD